MNRLLLYELFTEWNKTEGLVKLGVGDYFLLLQLITEKATSVQTFEDLVFTCETCWLKTWEQQPAFHQLFEKRRKAILEFIEGLNKKSASSNIILPAETIQPATAVTGTPDPGAGSGSQDGQTDTGPKRKDPEPLPKPPEKEPEGLVFINLGADTAGANPDGAAQGYSFSTQNEVLSASRRYLFGTEYFPVSSRILQQIWRGLYNNQEGEKLGEISLPDTIKKISREGYFFDFVYQPAEINRLSLFIFIDQGGSMAAQEAFGKALVNTAFESEVHGKVQPYFFYNVPEQDPDDNEVYILYNENRTESYTTTKLFKGLNKKNIVLLVFSDGGAIIGNVNDDRLKETETFLKTILKYTGFVAWLNPAPEHRWNGTTAGGITLRVPGVGMFEADRLGIAQAVNALKGKLTPILKKQYVAAASRKYKTNSRK